MNITALLNAVRDSIKRDAPLSAWCVTNYSKPPTIHKGVDTRKPPAAADYPVIHLFPVDRNAGEDVQEQEITLGISCGIYEEAAATTTTEGEAIVIELTGIDHLEAFRKLVETAAAGGVTGDARLTRLRIDYETIEYFPFLLARMELTISVPYSLGDDALD